MEVEDSEEENIANSYDNRGGNKTSNESKTPRRFFACRCECESVLKVVVSVRGSLMSLEYEHSRSVYCASDID